MLGFLVMALLAALDLNQAPGATSAPVIGPGIAVPPIVGGTVTGPPLFTQPGTTPPGSSFQYVTPPPTNPIGQINYNPLTQTVTPNLTFQTPQGPISGVTVIANNSGTGIIAIAQTPQQQAIITPIVGKVNQQLRGVM